MARKENWEKYTPDSIKNQADLERRIKEVMDSSREFNEKQNNVYALLEAYASNTANKDKTMTTSTNNNANEGFELASEELSKKREFSQFYKEYKGLSATKAAVSLTAFIVKIIPQVIARLTMKAGRYIDLAGTTPKGAGHELAIGDLGRSIGPKDTDLEYNPHRELINAVNKGHNTLGLISGTGKLISELGSNLGGMGAALHTASSLDISSPTKRFINKQKQKTKDNSGPSNRA